MASLTLYSVSYDLSHALLGAIGSVLPTGPRALITSGDVVTGLAVLVFGALLLAASMLNTILLIWWERKLLAASWTAAGRCTSGTRGCSRTSRTV